MPYLVIEKTKLHYEIYGQGEPLVFLHGYFLDIRCYKSLFTLLGKSFKVYVFDLPGHGKSDKIDKGRNIKYMCVLLKRFIQKLEIKNPILFGHSAGALIALYYASENKDVKSLVLSAPPGLKYYRSRLILFLKIFFLHPAICFVNNPIRSIPMFYFAFLNLAKNLSKQYFSNMEEMLTKEHSVLKKIKIKTILLWPKFDVLFPIGFSKLFSKKIKHSKLFVFSGTHEWPVLDPAKVLNYVGEFKK